MSNSPLHLSLTKEALAPVRAVYWVVCGSQVVGMAIAFMVWSDRRGVEAMWTGAALATLPGFLFGLAFQNLLHPSSLAKNSAVLVRMGILSLMLFAAAFLIPISALRSRAGHQTLSPAHEGLR